MQATTVHLPELIETLWNVNVDTWAMVMVDTMELIETLWNVNIEAERLQTLPDGELIETLWNVNNKKWGGTWERIRINRNIVECK